MIYIGDVHGKFKELQKIIEQYPDQPIIQVGDMGIGFGRYPHDFGPNFYFIRGNHDDPKKCRYHLNYLGDYGVSHSLNQPKTFCVSGANSIDKNYRTPGKTWWAQEELSYQQGQICIGWYNEIRPNIVVSHDAPQVIRKLMVSHHVEESRTSQLLTALFEIHQPKLWVFGHHHKRFDHQVEGTRFVCLEELGVLHYAEQ